MNIMIMATLTLLIFLWLLLPLAKMLTPHHQQNTTKMMMKKTFITSLILLIFFLNNDQTITLKFPTTIHLNTFDIHINILMDIYSIMFTTIAIFITWSIMDYSIWYMSSDPNINKFTKYLTIFLLSMLVILTANNLYQLFIGWEGVGIMSFLLIGWWMARTDANTAALQAIIYNRIGDTGMIILLLWFNTSSSWNLQEIFSQNTPHQILPLLGLLLAAMGKSAQFGLHPWLPSAMEGPTPVSALLHSSTMVVAGVFLIVRLYPIMQNNQSIISLCLMLGALTTLMSAIVASTQNDIKKIIALSTTSQLGLMMVTLGLNKPTLAFMHMMMHSFFKAMLFLCAGVLIHNMNNDQDMRKMGNLNTTFPTTSSAITTASLALIGTPFLSGFYSKDVIIETMLSSRSNTWAILLTLAATALSALYSTRMIMLTLLGNTKNKQMTTHHETMSTMLPISRLLLGTVMAGMLIKLMPNNNTSTFTFPEMIKLAASLITIMSLIWTLDMINMKKHLPNPKNKMLMTHANHQFMFFNTTHRALPLMTLKSSQILSTEMLDMWSMENIGPKGLMKINLTMTHISTQQKTLIKNYLLLFSMTIIMTSIMFMP
uniref:NADH-ubiquinone oxidoreductase chain 5 n=1 Tax=Gerrhopilus ceylonicus TaxID=3148149 RepID=A0PDM6_9SAUR|nr:NADH dehydrogenase subunit 5 [Gerrhopilus mirus]